MSFVGYRAAVFGADKGKEVVAVSGAESLDLRSRHARGSVGGWAGRVWLCSLWLSTVAKTAEARYFH